MPYRGRWVKCVGDTPMDTWCPDRNFGVDCCLPQQYAGAYYQDDLRALVRAYALRKVGQK